MQSLGQTVYINASKGKADLTSADFNKKTYYLDSKWEFYPNKLYVPEDFVIDKLDEVKYVNVPGLWNNKENKSLFSSGEGYGTYRIVIKTDNKKELLAININRIQSAYKIWINNKFIGETGTVGVNRYTMKPKWTSSNYIFLKEKDQIEIIIQVSNFYHKKGGIENSIILSNPQNINESTQHVLIFDIFLLGVILMMGLYHFGLFLLRSKDISTLFFSLTMIFSAIFSITTGEILFSTLFPSASWEILIKTNYISNYARLLFFILFLRSLFRAEYNSKVIPVIIYIGMAMILFTILTPARLYTNTLIVFLILIGISSFFIMRGIIRATIKKLDGALLSLIGITFLFITAANDILLEFNIIKTITLATLGFFVFVFFQSHMLSLQTAGKYVEVNKITQQLVTLGQIKDGFLSSNYMEINKPIDILKNIINADRAILIIYEDEKWIIKYDNKEENINNQIFNNNTRKLITEQIAEEVITLQQNIIINKDIAQENDGKYMTENDINNVFIMPLKEKGNVLAMLVFENKKGKDIFNENIINILMLAESQISMFIDTHLIYTQINELNENLEEKVASRTSEIVKQNDILELQRNKIEEKNKNLNDAYSDIKIKNKEVEDSINYAKKIQNSILPDSKSIKQIFPESFILYKPKDILSGDFYWADTFTVNNEEIIFMTIADCTGHGVPGSLMSIVGNNLLYDSIMIEKTYDTAKILDKLQEKISHRLNRDIDKYKFRDSIDLALIAFNPKRNTIQYSGARNPLIHVRDNKLVEYVANKKSVGETNARIKEKIKNFTSKTIEIQKGDVIFMFTDGYVDQIGGKYNRKFMKKDFYKLLSEISQLSETSQHNILSKTLINWQNENKQTDDILITGIKF